MKTASHEFHALLRAAPGDVTTERLSALSLAELQLFAAIMASPISGTKATVIERLLTVVRLRMVLAPFEDPDALVAAFKGRELREMARAAGCWLAPNKRGLAAGLLNWRNEGRRKGTAVYNEWRAFSASQPRQLRLF